MAETVKYVDDEHKSIFLKLLNEQRLEGEHCDIAVVVEDVKFRAHRCVLAACSNYFKKLFKKHEVAASALPPAPRPLVRVALTRLTRVLQVDNSSVIEIDFIRSDIFEEVLNYMYTAKISVKKKDVNLMMSSGQILGIRFLDKLCSQVGGARGRRRPDARPSRLVRVSTETGRVLRGQRQVSLRHCQDGAAAGGPASRRRRGPLLPEDARPRRARRRPQPAFGCLQVLGEHDDSAPADDLVETPSNQVLDKSPSAALHVQEAILKELANEDVHKVRARARPPQQRRPLF